MHGSDGPEAAKKELGLWFGKGDIVEWQASRLAWTYDAREER